MRVLLHYYYQLFYFSGANIPFFENLIKQTHVKNAWKLILLQ